MNNKLLLMFTEKIFTKQNINLSKLDEQFQIAFQILINKGYEVLVSGDGEVSFEFSKKFVNVFQDANIETTEGKVVNSHEVKLIENIKCIICFQKKEVKLAEELDIPFVFIDIETNSVSEKDIIKGDSKTFMIETLSAGEIVRSIEDSVSTIETVLKKSDSVENSSNDFEEYKGLVRKTIEKYIGNNQLEAAKNLISEYEGIVKYDVNIYCAKAIINIMENRLDDAEIILHKANKIEINNFDILYNLGYLYEIMNEKELCCEYYSKAEKITTDRDMIKEIQNKISIFVNDTHCYKHITSIIILTYNNLEYTKLCLESIKKHTEIDMYEIIVVDNNSTDGTKKWLKDQTNIELIINIENLGFPKGCNQGIAIAKGDSILLLNNDVIVTPNWLSNLSKALWSSSKIGAVGAITNSCSYYQAIKVKYNNINEMIDFAGKHNYSDDLKWEQRVRLVGFCMLIKKKVIDVVGLLDERFTPGNFEDDDYSYRISNLGYKLILCKDTFIHHYGSASFKKEASKYNELFITNSKKFEKKWGFNSNEASFINQEVVKLIHKSKNEMLNVLEMGCGCGATLIEIKNKFKNVNLYGLELNKKISEIANKVVNLTTTYVENENLNYDKEIFDYIIINREFCELSGFSNIINKAKICLKDLGEMFIITKKEDKLDSNLLENYVNISNGLIGKIINNDLSTIIIIKKLNDIELYQKILMIYDETDAKDSLYQIVDNINEDKIICDKIINFIDFCDINKINILNKIIAGCIERESVDNIYIIIEKALEYDKINEETLKNVRKYYKFIGDLETSFKVDKVLNSIKIKSSKRESALDIEQNNVQFTGERLVINSEVKNKYNDVLEEHIERYKLACKYVKNMRVLDAACGAGYGSKMLAEFCAKEVIGMDISNETLMEAKTTYKADNLSFNYGDVNNLPFEDASFDVVVSFETIEHIEKGGNWIRESSRILKEDGLFIVSTPNRYITNTGTYIEEPPLNQYHQYEYNIGEFVGELLKEYDILELFGQTFVNDSDLFMFQLARQHRKLDTSYAPKSKTLSDNHKLISMSEIKNSQPMYLVAVCRKKVVKILNKDKEHIENQNCDNVIKENSIGYNSRLSKLFYGFGENSFIDKDYAINKFQSIFIGSKTFIKDNCWLNVCIDDDRSEPRILIKEECQIGSRFSVSSSNKCTIEKNVIIGPNVYIADCEHNYRSIGVPIMHQGITSVINEVVVGENSWIGVNATIVGNVHIGRGCVIGANSYVTKDIPDYSVVGGSPAKIIKMYDTVTQEWVRVKTDDEVKKIIESRKKLPLISICIPTFNRVKELEKCLNSIYTQIGNDSLFEVFISNNDSSDGTEELINKYKNIYTNLTYHRNEINIGGDKNIALTIRKSKGKYIVLHGDDDYFKQNVIYQLVNIINTNNQSSLFFINVLSNENEVALYSGINDFLKVTSIAAGFISAIIMSRVEYEKIEEPLKFIDTNFNQIYLQYSILLNNPNFVLVNSAIFNYEGNNPNGYNFGKVFIKNYLDILYYFRKDGLKEENITQDKQNVLNSTIIPWYKRIISNNMDIDMTSFEEYFGEYYGKEPYFKEAFKILKDIKQFYAKK